MISQIRDAFCSKKISALEFTTLQLKKAKNDKHNAFVTLAEEQAIHAAKQADRAGFLEPAPALRGIPLALKDNIITKGLRTTCASKILATYIPPYDADVTGQLKTQGAVTLGKANLDEFAMGGSGENSAYGPSLNPVNPLCVPGGSSSGSAVAVKAGLAVAALGSDTGGSIRLPASFTGLVGVKPTYGLVSRYGLVAFASSLDQIGPLTHTVADAAILLSAITGASEQDATHQGHPPVDYLAELKKPVNGKLKIGIPKEYFSAGLEPAVVAVTQNVINTLKSQGHETVELSLPHTPYSVAVYYIVAVSEASSNLSRFDGARFGARAQAATLNEMYKKTRALFGPEVKRRIVLGTFALSSGYYDAYYKKACLVRRLIADDFTAAFQKCDVILVPLSPTTAFRLGSQIADPLKMYLNDILTIPANLAGLPAVSVPAGRDAAGMPVGVQFLGPHFSEAKLLQCAQFVERNVYREPEVSYL